MRTFRRRHAVGVSLFFAAIAFSSTAAATPQCNFAFSPQPPDCHEQPPEKPPTNHVPEPGELILLCSAGVAAFMARRRKNK